MILAGCFLLLAVVGFKFRSKQSVPQAVRQNKAFTVKNLAGAWRLQNTTDPERKAPNVIKIMIDGAFTAADYDLNNKKFISAQGGTFSLNKNTYAENIEYFTRDSTRVGSTQTYKISLKGTKLVLTGTQSGKAVTETWERVDGGAAPLAGAWRIRERETTPGQMTTIQRGPRKTIKWLSGTRFQWAAINTDTKQFFGTGGGTYTLQEGKYTEHIEFFSRDAQRVGMAVSFDYELKNGDWHHRGFSTTGNKIYEVWAREKSL
jgi:hypothetical protein